MKRAVFLDRDGVLNRAIVRDGKPYPPKSLEELELLPGVTEATTALREAGFLLVMVTNQPDVARGTADRAVVEAISTRLMNALRLDATHTCYHDTLDNCECRKPKPGLLLMAARSLGIDLKASYMVGDRWRDTEAGERAGCATLFIDYGYDERRPESFNHRVASLWEAAQIILKEGKPP